MPSVDPPSQLDQSQRLGVMLELLATQGRLSVGEACRRLGVSEATIRRDFTELAGRQLATRTHGGVVAAQVAYELPGRYRSGARDGAKARIAVHAARLVGLGEVVGMNGGTTTTGVARALCERPDLAEAEADPALTIVTNALNIATEAVLRPYLRCVSLGGVARPESYEVTGPLASLVLERLWLDVAILGVDAFSAAAGATCHFEAEAAISNEMATRAQRVVVVGTGDKIGRRTFAAICPAEAATTLVTDGTADEAALDTLRGLGVDVVVV